MPKLEPIIERLNAVRTELEALLAEVPEERWQQRPRTGTWSVGEVVAHLTMVEEAIAGGTAKQLSKPPRAVPFWKRLHIPLRVVEWRWPRRESPIPLDATRLAGKAEMLSKFAAARQASLALLEANRNRDLSQYRAPHPFLGSLNYYDWYRLMASHEIRHSKQIREIIQSFRK
jgi:hypothetical protein